MFGFPLSNIIYLLFLASASADDIEDRDHYIKRTLAHYDLCYSMRVLMDSLPDNRWDDDKTGIIVEMPNLKGHGTCELVVEVSGSHDILAVVQSMNLRGNHHNCIDYIQFRTIDGRKTERFCGRMDDTVEINSQIETYSKGAIGHLEISSPCRLMMFVHISDTPIHVDEINPDPTILPSYLTVVFTQANWCTFAVFDRRYQNLDRDGMNVCIRKDFICDGYRNCFSENCNDEDNCTKKYTEMCSDKKNCKYLICRGDRNCHPLPSTYRPGQVIVCVFVTIGGIVFLWACKTHSEICGLCNCAMPRSKRNSLSRNRHQTDVLAHPLGAVALNSEDAIVPTASFLEETAVGLILEGSAAPIVTVEDPPPAYDALFPEQSHQPSKTAA